RAVHEKASLRIRALLARSRPVVVDAPHASKPYRAGSGGAEKRRPVIRAPRTSSLRTRSLPVARGRPQLHERGRSKSYEAKPHEAANVLIGAPSAQTDR